MKTTKQIIRQATCLFLSALLLSTSLPMQSFAQDLSRGQKKIIKEMTEEIEKMTPAERAELYRAVQEPIYVYNADYTIEIPVGGDGKVLETLDQETLSKIVKTKPDHLFGPVDTYAKYARVQAVQAKGGEEIVTVLADGTKETKNVAKAGDYILTNPGGEQYIVGADKFAKKYEAATELGEGWFKPKGGPQQFRQMRYDMTIIAPWGEEQVFKKGAYLNVTDVNDLYGVAEQEFHDTYKSIRTLYRENFNGIQRFVSKIEERLYKRFPKYRGVFFRKFLKNDVKYMEERLADKAAKQAAKNTGKKAAKRTALRTFGGVAMGIGLYFAFTYMTAPTVQAQNLKVKTHGEIIKDLTNEVKGIKDAAAKGAIIENMARFINPKLEPVIINDTIENDGKLLEEMGSIIPAIKATGLTEDEVVDLIVDEAVEEQEYQLPSYNPFKNIKADGTISNVSFN